MAVVKFYDEEALLNCGWTYDKFAKMFSQHDFMDAQDYNFLKYNVWAALDTRTNRQGNYYMDTENENFIFDLKRYKISKLDF
jgi:hypothetical protein